MVVQKKVPSVEALERLHRLAYSVPDALDFSQPVEILTDSPAVLAELECW